MIYKISVLTITKQFTWLFHFMVSESCKVIFKKDIWKQRVYPEVIWVIFHSFTTRTTDTQWRHKSKISEKLGRCGRQNMLRPYLKIWDWDWIFGRAVKAFSSLGVRSPWFLAFFWGVLCFCSFKIEDFSILGPIFMPWPRPLWRPPEAAISTSATSIGYQILAKDLSFHMRLCLLL